MLNENTANQQHQIALQSSWRASAPVDLVRSLAILQRGLGDPTIRLEPRQVWLAFATRTGDATLRIEMSSNQRDFQLSAWGPGAECAVKLGPNLLGASDDWTDFDEPAFASALPDLVLRTRGAHRAVHLPRTGRVFDHAAGAILEQRVTGIEANYAWRWLIQKYGRPAPGPAPTGLRLFPLPEQLAAVPRWDWQQARVDQARARTLIRLSHAASRLEGWAELELSAPKPGVPGEGTLEAALLSISGIGPWTVAETLQRSHGSPDHISVGDYHLAHFVGQLLIGRRVDDLQMLRLLEPYAGHRQRIIRLLQLSGQRKQAFGPRYAPEDHRNR